MLRVLQPFLVATLVGAGTVAALWWFLPQAGVVLLVALVLSATAVPWLTGRLARREESRQATVRGELTAGMVDLVEGGPELLIMGAVGGQLGRIDESDAQLRRATRQGAGTTGIGLGLTTALAGLASWGALSLGVIATHRGSLNGALLGRPGAGPPRRVRARLAAARRHPGPPTLACGGGTGVRGRGRAVQWSATRPPRWRSGAGRTR